MKALKWAMIFAVAGVLIAASEFILGKAPQAALLLNLGFWIAIFQGCIAIVAVVDLTDGKWILPVRRQLLAVVPMIAFCAIVFSLLAPSFSIYPLHEARGAWFDKKLFLIRNIAVLLVSFLLALQYKKEALKDSENRFRYAILYLFSFVATQSMVAFDWYMPLEYPWISTLLGGFFFVESLYMGLACSGLFCLLQYRQDKREGKPISKEWQKARYDTGVMMFGFCTLWLGLFFSQLIVIWYGNLPEEVVFLTKRLAVPAYHAIAYCILVAMFAIPFFTLMIKRAKQSATVVAAISLLVLAGLMMERYFFVAPAAKVFHLSLIAEFLIIAMLSFAVLSSSKKVVGE